MGILDHLTASWEICIQAKKQHLESDMEQQTGSKQGKEYVKVVYCHAAYLTYMQSISCQAGSCRVGKVMSQLFNMLSRLVINFSPKE